MKGFSLIELMIVVVIMGLLAGVLAPKIMDRPDDARVTKAKMDIKTLKSALGFYKLDNGIYPNTKQGLSALIAEPDSRPRPTDWRHGGYLDSSDVPKDPWGNEYIYRSPGAKERDYEIVSFGSDGKRGGSSYAKDIHSWDIQE